MLMEALSVILAELECLLVGTRPHPSLLRNPSGATSPVASSTHRAHHRGWSENLSLGLGQGRSTIELGGVNEFG